MNQPASMRSAEAACGLQVEAEAGVERGGVGERVAVLVAGQRGAGDEFHGDEDAALLRAGVFADFVDVDDVGVRDAGHGLRLLQHAGSAKRAMLRAVAQDFDGDFAIKFGVVGGIDDAHAAGPELTQDQIAADARRQARLDGLADVDASLVTLGGRRRGVGRRRVGWCKGRKQRLLGGDGRRSRDRHPIAARHPSERWGGL